eukprot:6482624-Amphidinium_carterae.1
MQAAREYTTNFDETDALFRTVYEWVTWLSSQGELAENWQTEEGMRAEWTEFELFSMFGTRGEKAKRSRWFQASRRWREMRSSGGHILLSVLYLGLNSEWWGDLASSPWRLRAECEREVERR